MSSDKNQNNNHTEMSHQPARIVWVGNDSHTGFESKEACLGNGNGSWQCWKCYDTSDDDGEDGIKDVHDIIADYIHIASIIFGTVGIISNFLSIYILSQPGLSSRFSRLLIILAFFDIAYLTLCLVEAIIKRFDECFPGKNLMNLYLILFPQLFHPWKQILQTSTIILTVIFSMDRYVALFHPYMVYSVEGWVSTLLRGPKREHTILYLLGILIPSIVYCTPHFFEYATCRGDNGIVSLDEGFLMGRGMTSFYYKLFYYTILDLFIRIIIPVCILAFTNVRILMLFDKKICWVWDLKHPRKSLLKQILFSLKICLEPLSPDTGFSPSWP